MNRGTVGILIVWLALSFVHQKLYYSATPASRLDLLHAVVMDGSLALDRRRAKTPDVAWVNGHYYSDKAPGTATLALPAFVSAAGVLRGVGVDLDSKTGWLVTSWAACAFSQALPAALGAAALFVWLRRFVIERAALVTVLALTLGSLPLPYSTLLFSHAQVIGLIGIAIWAMGMFREVGSENLTRLCLRPTRCPPEPTAPVPLTDALTPTPRRSEAKPR